VSSFDNNESSPVSVRVLCDTIEDRLVETFDLVRERLARVGFQGSLPAGTVLVGGTAQLYGIRRLAAEVLESPVRVGTPSGILAAGDQLSNPAFASSVGLLRWGLSHSEYGGLGSGSSPLRGALDSLRRWLSSFLP
jgi:cell division protein FtsA